MDIVGFLDIIFATVSLVVYVVDIITDLILFHDYYAQNAVLESRLTLTFVLLPSVVFFLDKFYSVGYFKSWTWSKKKICEVLIGIKDALLIFFTIIIIYGKLIYQYWRILRVRTSDRESHVKKLKNLKYEASKYQFYESGFEALPQLIWQTILIMTDVRNNSFKTETSEIIRLITMATSWLSISWGIMCYVSRYPCAVKKLPNCKEMPLCLRLRNFLGHVFIVGANVLALSFAAQIPQSTVPEVNILLSVLIILCAFAIRLLIMLTWRKCDKENLVLKNCSQIALLVFGICVPSEDGDGDGDGDGDFCFTDKLYIHVFDCDFIQNSIFILVWYLQTSLVFNYQVAFIVFHYVFMTLGFRFMISFYWKFQPYISKIMPRPNDCDNNELSQGASAADNNSDGEEDNSRVNGVAGDTTVLVERHEIENEVQSPIPENSPNIIRYRNVVDISH